jgi:hypothetical protein
MQAWLESVAGPNYATALMWTIFALIAFLVILVTVRIVRGLTFGTFVSGGKNRKTRLAVMDATAVDSQRRLVLVRRDDIEHLILIGGPTDVVVEQNIRMVPRRTTHEDHVEPSHAPVATAQPAPSPAPAAPRPVAQRPAPVPPPPASVSPVVAAPALAPRPAAPAYRPPVEPRFAGQDSSVAASRPPVPSAPTVSTPAPRVDVGHDGARVARPPMPPATVTPVANEMTSVTSPSSYRPAPVAPTVRPIEPARTAPNLDDALVEELKGKLETNEHRMVAEVAERSLDEEMDKLLGDLSRGKA